MSTTDEDGWVLELAPWDGRRVPVTLLGGYLGAGKTTLVNSLLARTSHPLAVIVNDVGEVNVDASLVKRRHGDTLELTDGCICCSLGQGLAQAFATIRAREEPPTQVVIELSGVAEPRRVVPWTTSAGFTLDAIVALVDAEQFPDQLHDPLIGPLVRRQVAAADLVMITKQDLVDEQTLGLVETRSRELAPAAPVVRSSQVTALAGIVGLGARQHRDVTSTEPATLFDVHVTTTVAFPPAPTHASITELLDGLPARTVRAKGVALIEDGTLLLVQVVGARRTIEALPQAEAQEPTDLVVIELVAEASAGELTPG